MYLAAHPDDENTRLLSWLVNDQHANTSYLSLTRGDGGQNIIGSEQGAALGLIRTYELLEARKVDGAGQLFSRAIDFGFSKTKEETFSHWNADLLTRDVVWSIRKHRPDLIICRFPPDTRAGHGQHAASAVIAGKAFEAAGDKRRYADQLDRLSPWRPRSIIFNSFRFGSANTISAGQLEVQTGQYDALSGMGYSELAGKSRSLHHSQGVGTPAVPGLQYEYFEHVAGDKQQKSLFDGLDTGWSRIGRRDIGEDLDRIIAAYKFTAPDRSLKDLLEFRKKIRKVADKFWREQKLKELDDIILDCCGFMVELVNPSMEAAAGQKVSFSLNAIARTGLRFRLLSMQWNGNTIELNKELENDLLSVSRQELIIPPDAPLTEPYWLSKKPADAFHFTIPADSLTGVADMASNLKVMLAIEIEGQVLSIQVPLSYKHLDPVKGDISEPLRIVPAVMTGFTQATYLIDEPGDLITSVHLRNITELKNASIRLSYGKVILGQLEGINRPAGSDTVYQIQLGKALNITGEDPLLIRAEVISEGRIYNLNQHLIKYDHIPTLQYFSPAEARVLKKTWKAEVGKVGYIAGAGDYTADFLRQAGLDVVSLKESDFASSESLKPFDVIISGVRAVNVERRMQYWLPVLMEYVQEGGKLVMQYNTVQELSTEKLGPYPFSISSKRVTEEDAPVKIKDPSDALLNYPNKIRQKDFDNWVQERGLYFANTWDKRYRTPFSMHDKDEAPLEGGTLYCNYGRGMYIYTSISFFRQLPAGNPGAIRLLMNFISNQKR